MNHKLKSILVILLVVLMLVSITGVAVAGRLKGGEQYWNYCGTWAALEPFTMPGHNIGNGMCPF